MTLGQVGLWRTWSGDVKPIRAKVRGARYYAQLYVRTAPDQTPQDALRAFLGSLAEEVEIEGG